MARPTNRPQRHALLTVARLLPRTGRRHLVVYSVLILLGGLLPNALTLATGWLVHSIERGIAGAGASVLVAPLTLVGVLFVLSNAHAPLMVTVAGVMGSRFDTAIRDEVMRMASAPAGIAHLEDPRVTDRLQSAEELLHGWLTSAAVRGFAQTMTGRIRGLAAAGILASFRWWLPLIVLAGYRAWRAYGIHTGFMFLRRVESTTQGLRRARYLLDLITSGEAAKETRVFGAGEWFIDKFRRAWDDGMLDLWRERLRHQVWLVPAATACGAAAAVAAWIIGRHASDGSITIASAVVLLQSIFAMQGFANQGDGEWQMHAGAERVRNARTLGEVVFRPDSDLRGTKPAARPVRTIRFEGVRFSYPGDDRLVLDGLDLDVTVGSSLAIVGENGAGKTTLIKLLSRLYDPTAGRITIDGTDLREIDPRSWRRQIGVIFQDFVRFELPGRDNIASGAIHHRDDEQALRSAARRAGAEATLDRVGWDATLSRRYAGGVELSGGEWQRVALARALFAIEGGARLLILDEPTANLDVRAEAELYERFLDITSGVTTIVISHRFSTVRVADRICVLEHGRVVEVGSHDELMRVGQHYARMFGYQASAYEDHA